MKKQISLSEVESLIRNSINEKGMSKHISEEQIEEIKKKIKARLAMPSAGVFFMNTAINRDVDGDGEVDMDGGFDAGGIEEATIPSDEEDQTIQVSQDNNPVSHETEIDDSAIENAKKEGELETKEQILSKQAEELESKEHQLNDKEEDLKYKPTLPDSVLQAEPGKLFIYDMNQLSLGGESLSNQPYNTLDNPENKSSMHDLWIKDGKVRAQLYKVEFKPIGEMVFDPFNGTSKFVEMQQPLESDLPKEERDGVQQAIDSQIPKEPMIDSVEPVVDVTMPQSDDMGLKGTDIQKAIENTVEKILRQYFSK